MTNEYFIPTADEWLHSCIELGNEESFVERRMALDWQVIAIGCGALVMTVITSFRSNPGAAHEQSGALALPSEDATRVERQRGELAQKLPLDSIR